MRLTPLSVWLSKLSDSKEIFKAIKNESEFTHPNKFVHETNFIYTMSIRYLLNNPKDPERGLNAFKIAEEYSKSMANGIY